MCIRDRWRVQPEDAADWKTEENGDLILTNQNPLPAACTVMVTASNDQGLEGAGQYEFGFLPLKAPVFKKTPEIREEGGVLKLQYTLKDPAGTDCSECVWYRSSNGEQAQAIPVAAGTKEYRLTCRDNGWFLMASVCPQSSSSEKGKAVWTSPVWICLLYTSRCV